MSKQKYITQILVRGADRLTIEQRIVTVEVDLEALAKNLGPRAAKSKSKRAVSVHGAVIVKVQ